MTIRTPADERIRIGSVWCNFMRREGFTKLCGTWLISGPFHHVVTLNPEMIMQAERDPAFKGALRAAELRVPDGAGLIWARWYLRSKQWMLAPSLLAFLFQPVERVTGVDAVMELARLCNTHALAIYLLGGAGAQTGKTAQLLRGHWPKLIVHTSPRHTFTLDGPRTIIADIQEKQPAVLLVAYGSPLQTLWIEHHRNKLSSVRIAVGVGGAFAMLSEELPRAPRMLRMLNLEWLWRLYLEPSRLPRIWQATVRFPLLVARQKRA